MTGGFTKEAFFNPNSPTIDPLTLRTLKDDWIIRTVYICEVCKKIRYVDEKVAKYKNRGWRPKRLKCLGCKASGTLRRGGRYRLKDNQR